MRAPVLGLFFSHDSEKLLEAARASALITHAHPLALDGAAMIATATSVAVRGRPSSEVLENAAASVQSEAYRERLALADQWLRQGMEVSVHDVRRNLGHEIAALDSVVTAVYLALRFRASDFSSLLSFIRELGGDVDTIGAMAGAIFGAMNGRSRLPSSELERLEQGEKIESLARAVHSAASA